MTLRSLLVVFGLGSGFSWTAFFLVLFTVPPDGAGTLGEAFFFGSLFMALTGTFTLLGVLGRIRRSRLLPALHLTPAFRQSVLTSLAVVGLLVLQRFRILRWWNMLLLVVLVAGLDLFFARRDREQDR